jgi:hypothetical protein
MKVLDVIMTYLHTKFPMPHNGGSKLSETSVNIFQTTRRNILEVSHLQEAVAGCAIEESFLYKINFYQSVS